MTKIILAVHEAYGHVGFLYKKSEAQVCIFSVYMRGMSEKKPSTRLTKAPMEHVVPEEPGELLSVDFYSPLPTSTRGVKHIFVTIDAFSKLLNIYPIKRATIAVIFKIFEHYCKKIGKLKKFIYDHGMQFTSTKW